MKKKLLLALSLVAILTVMLAISVSAQDPIEAWDVSANGDSSVMAYLYNDLENDGYYTLTISGEGDMKGWSSSSGVPWYSSYRSKIKSVTIENGVTSISKYAFYGCTKLTSVTFGECVASIGNWAFYGCTNLTSVTIGECVTSIGNYAFRECTSLAEINFNAVAMDDLSSSNDVFCNAGKNGKGIKATIGKNVTKIPAYLFCPYSYSSSYSPKITSLEFEEGSACTSIGNYAFYDCTSLTSIEIPDSVTSIGNSAFYGCTSLKSLYLSDIVAWCGIMFSTYSSNPLYYAEHVCLNGTFIADIIIPDSVTRINSYAFSGCYNLTSITIPDSVTSIGDNAFCDCTSLTIYCEAESKPSGWSSFWNYSNRLVVWGYAYENVYLENIFTFKGYSFNEAGSIAVGFDIDYEALAKYEEKTGKTLEIGVLFAGFDNLGGKQPLDSKGQAIALDAGRVVKADLTSFNYPSYDFVLTDVVDSIRDVKLVISAYIYNGENVKYVQENGLSDTVSGISYNEAKENVKE